MPAEAVRSAPGTGGDRGSPACRTSLGDSNPVPGYGGCISSKTLIRAAEQWHRADRSLFGRDDVPRWNT